MPFGHRASGAEMLGGYGIATGYERSSATMSGAYFAPAMMASSGYEQSYSGGYLLGVPAGSSSTAAVSNGANVQVNVMVPPAQSLDVSAQHDMQRQMWGSQMSWMQDNEFEAWVAWQQQLQSAKLSQLEQRLRLLETLRAHISALRGAELDAMADRMLKFNREIGGDKYGRVQEMSTLMIASTMQAARDPHYEAASQLQSRGRPADALMMEAASHAQQGEDAGMLQALMSRQGPFSNQRNAMPSAAHQTQDRGEVLNRRQQRLALPEVEVEDPTDWLGLPALMGGGRAERVRGRTRLGSRNELADDSDHQDAMRDSLPRRPDVRELQRELFQKSQRQLTLQPDGPSKPHRRHGEQSHALSKQRVPPEYLQYAQDSMALERKQKTGRRDRARSNPGSSYLHDMVPTQMDMPVDQYGLGAARHVEPTRNLNEQMALMQLGQRREKQKKHDKESRKKHRLAFS